MKAAYLLLTQPARCCTGLAAAASSSRERRGHSQLPLLRAELRRGALRSKQSR